MKQKMSREEFIQWWVDSKDELSLTNHELAVYRTISAANVHTALYGCDIIIHMPRGNRSFKWECAAGDDCPREQPVYWKGVKPPSPENVQKALEDAEWLASPQ